VFLIAFEANMDLSLSREFYIIFNTLYGFGIRSKVKNTIRRTSVQELCPHPAVASTVQTGTSDIALLDFATCSLHLDDLLHRAPEPHGLHLPSFYVMLS